MVHFILRDNWQDAGGVECLYVNERLCKTVVVREWLCTKDIEMLTVSLCPGYLSKEFPQIFVSVVYIHPKVNTNLATEYIEKNVTNFQSLPPDAQIFMMSDFNNCALEKTVRNMQQYVMFPTRHNIILDQCYGSIKGAYKSTLLAPLG